MIVELFNVVEENRELLWGQAGTSLAKEFLAIDTRG